MEITQKNCRIVDEIIEILSKEKCTVEDAQDILNTVVKEIRQSSTVQVTRKLLKVYYD